MEHSALLSPFQAEFLRLEFQRPLDLYVRRCQAMGLCGQDLVLDAGCGMGQWSIALGLLNRTVVGVDFDSVRLGVAERLALRRGGSNVRFRWAQLEALPLEDGGADAILCYSVLMFADMRRALGEMRRVLKPGGRLLVMVDLWRWHWTRLRTGRLSGLEFAKMAVKRALGRRSRTLFGQRYFLRMLEDSGFAVHQAGAEGTVGFCPARPGPELVFFPDPDPLHPRLLEVAAVRRG